MKRRSAPYVIPENRDEGYCGFTYEFLYEDQPPRLNSGPSSASNAPDQQDDVGLESPSDISPLKRAAPQPCTISEDKRDFVNKTIEIYHHCLPGNSIIPVSLKGYMSFVYDELPTGAINSRKVNDTEMSVNIFGWRQINDSDIDSLYIHLGDQHLLELLNVLGHVYLKASTQTRFAKTPLVEGSYNFFSPFSNTFNHSGDDRSYATSIFNIHDYEYHYNLLQLTVRPISKSS